MRAVEIEGWALRVVDAVRAGQHVEDTRLELKAAWPDPVRAARRLAGHLNASRGDDVLWLIGLDEASGVTGAAASDTSAWWASVVAEFVDVVPTPTDVAVVIDGLAVVALHFTSEAVPYVVRNPAHGTAGSVVEREVPWREATGIRSARRADLIRMLLPQVQAPRAEVLAASVAVTAERRGKDQTQFVGWEARVSLFCDVELGAAVVIPWHRVSFVLRCGEVVRDLDPQLTGHSVTEHGGQRIWAGPKIVAATIHTGAQQLIIEGPGRFYLHGTAREVLGDDLLAIETDRPATLDITWLAVDAALPQRLALELPGREPNAWAPGGEERPWQRRWAMAADD